MNDRYLFRAKRVDNGEWVEGVLTIMWRQLHIINPDYENTAYPIDESTICQCTGLTDKNGKLIWENDIIRYADMIIGTEKIDRIEWNETHASFVRLHTSQMGLQYLYIDEFIANGCEVIGNIFENPELIKLD